MNKTGFLYKWFVPPLSCLFTIKFVKGTKEIVQGLGQMSFMHPTLAPHDPLNVALEVPAVPKHHGVPERCPATQGLSSTAS